jgi:hypothetical protein
MTRRITRSLRLAGATVAVAAAMAGFAGVDSHPAAPTDLAVVQSFHPVGQ